MHTIMTLLVSVRFCYCELSASDAQASLASELASVLDPAHLSRLDELQAELQPTFDAMPKEDGLLGHQAVRYVLHRLFVERHSWYVRGLEPTDEDKPVYLDSDWVPTYLQNMLEERLHGRGVNLEELTALAASIEDLVHKEALENMERVYKMHELPLTGGATSAQVHSAVATYMMFYLDDHAKFTQHMDLKALEAKKARFQQTYADWAAVEEWFRGIVDKHLTEAGGIVFDFAHMKKLVGDLSEKFGFFNDKECHDLKNTMLNIKDGQSGRVRLSDFYAASLHSHWQFNEKADYLKSIGALDDRDAAQPRVIVTNYMMSRSNCLESSDLYAVCCRNECEDLMSKLEVEIVAPTAQPARIVELVKAMNSDTVIAPRGLTATQLRLLDQIAAQNSGKIPLHGRLFAQWMHHAFPRECPYPHEAGAANPHTPDEWLAKTGQHNELHRVDRAEVEAHVKQASVVEQQQRAVSPVEEEPALHWSDTEHEVFAMHPAMRLKHQRQEGNSAGSSKSFVVFLAFCVLAGCGASLAKDELDSKKSELLPGSCGASRTQTQRRKLTLSVCAGALVVIAICAADSLGIFDRKAFVCAVGLAVVGCGGNAAMKRMQPARVGKAKGFDLWEGHAHAA